MKNNELYVFFLKRLKRYKKQLNQLHEQKVNALSVGEERRLLLEFEKMEARLTELREIFDHFELTPRSVKEKEEQI